MSDSSVTDSVRAFQISQRSGIEVLQVGNLNRGVNQKSNVCTCWRHQLAFSIESLGANPPTWA